jgi:hypothetical protein
MPSPTPENRRAPAWLTALGAVCALTGIASLVAVVAIPRVDVSAVGCGLVFAVILAAAVFVALTVVTAVVRIVRKPAAPSSELSAGTVPAAVTAAPGNRGPTLAQAITIAASGVLLLGCTCGVMLSGFNSKGPESWALALVGPGLILGWIVVVAGQVLLAKVAFRR